MKYFVEFNQYSKQYEVKKRLNTLVSFHHKSFDSRFDADFECEKMNSAYFVELNLQIMDAQV